MSNYEFLNYSLFQDQNLINELIKTAQDPKAMQLAGRLAAVLREQMTEPGKEFELPNNVILDKVPQMFDLKNPGNPGNIPLYVGNLRSAADFRQWLSNNNIVIKTDTGRTSTISERGNFDQNAAVQYIFNRAVYDSKNYIPENKTKALTYLNKAKSIASELQYTPTSGGQVQNSPAANQAQPGADAAHIVELVVRMRPFRSEFINLSDLSKFANYFAQIDSAVAGRVGTLNSAIATATQMMDGANTFRTSSLSLKTLQYQFPQIDKLAPLLLKIVADAGTLYQQFLNENEAVIQRFETEGGTQAMQQQIAVPLRTNINDLTQLNQEVVLARQKRGF